MICFHQPDTSCATDSGDNGSVVSRRQIDQERRFGRIGRSKPLDLMAFVCESFQLSLAPTFVPCASNRSSRGLASTPCTPKPARDGPNARKQIVPSSLPFKITPAIMTLSLPPTKPRVLMLSRRAVESSSYTSTRLMPVVFDLPLTIAV